jgi:hypothetical protein
MIEGDKTFLTRKIGSAIGKTLDTTQGVQATAATVYKYIPAWLMSWKTFLVAVILFGIVWVVTPYVKMFSSLADTVKSFMNVLSSPEEQPEPEAVAPPETELAETVRPDSTKDKIKAKLNTKAALSGAPKPDDAASSTQGGAQGGFCLAGEWKGQRTCLKVDRRSDCASGQLFDSQRSCENPSLR